MKRKLLVSLLLLNLNWLIFVGFSLAQNVGTEVEVATPSTSSIASTSVERVIKLGTSCALKGISSYLGKEYVGGLKAYINLVNARGGIEGYNIKLIAYDDGYEPGKCRINTIKLLDNDKVLALVCFTGTPTSKVALPLAEKKGVPFLFPYSGASFLRKSKVAFCLRASYVEEMVALCKFFKDMGLKKVAVFYQDDSFGRAGLGGVREGLKITGLKLIGEAIYGRNNPEVMAEAFYIADLNPDAVLYIGTFYQALNFIRYTCFTRADTRFGVISFANPVEIMKRLRCASNRVYGVSCVPSPYDEGLPIVAEYRKNIGSVRISPISLEGYMAGKVLIAGLRKALREFGKPTRKALLKVFQNLNVDLGGIRAIFSPEDHQALHRVWILGERSGKIETLRSYGR